MDKPHRRFALTPSDAYLLPIIVESVGHNPNQETIVRPDGYPYFHWFQTEDGEGSIAFGGKTSPLPFRTGVLLFPRVPHAYAAQSGVWGTKYVTFGGPAVESILSSVGIHESTVFHWRQDAPLTGWIDPLLDRLESGDDIFGIDVSSETYRFLLLLSRYGQLGGRAGTTANLEQIKPLLEWMELHYHDAGIGLGTLASVMQLSPRRVNAIFQETFGLSPYAYLIHLRIRKAKEMLVGSSEFTVKEIAAKAGFRDQSHFVATFRKHVGIPPDRFRKLH
ncbi:AraC family transcriptional regulator [Paenibacillus thermotolerans]|uniref:AraC family transcriptional regulator n=1 Tax=Paenibacillus thermotolerans TaxID=3027807 RepID=UPI002367F01F|nr:MULTISPECIES: AraC family transcriptional regulator [unclassified Paenibacillus]